MCARTHEHGCVKFRSTGWSAEAICVRGAVWILRGCCLCCLEHPPQLGQPGTELLPLDAQWDHLVHPDAVPAIVAYLVVCHTEPCRRVEAAKAAHGAIPSVTASVILFHAIVPLLTAAMDHLLAERLPNGARVHVVPILLGRVPEKVSARVKKRLAASLSRCSLSSESTRFPSASIAR